MLYKTLPAYDESKNKDDQNTYTVIPHMHPNVNQNICGLHVKFELMHLKKHNWTEKRNRFFIFICRRFLVKTVNYSHLLAILGWTSALKRAGLWL